jgi:GNAT superfamily N-acetyltransferase
MHITFERAAAEDAEALVRVQIAAFHHDSVLYPDVEIGGPPGYDSVEHALTKIRDEVYYAIRADGHIVGGIVVFDKGAGHWHLDLIYIDPAYHDRGIGSQALPFLEETHHASKWTLDTPSWAVRNRHFYEKFGYVKVGEEVYPGITLIAYEKNLPD